MTLREQVPARVRARLPVRLAGVPPDLVVVLLVAAALRVYRLGAESLWLDEAYSVVVAQRHSFAWLLVRLPAEDPHPPLHYVFLKAWMLLAGTSEVAVRTPSVVFGVGAVAVLYRLGSELFDREVGTIAGLLAAVSPFLVWYAQDARMYSLLLLLAGLSVLLLVRLTRSFTPRTVGAYVVVTALLGYTHAFGLFVILAQALFLLSRAVAGGSDRTLAPYRAVMVGGVVAFLLSPWLVRLATGIQAGLATIDWIPRPTPGLLLDIARTVAVGDRVHWRLAGAVPDWLALGAGALAFGCLGLSLVEVRRTSPPSWYNADSEYRLSAFEWGVDRVSDPDWLAEAELDPGTPRWVPDLGLDRPAWPAVSLLLLVLLTPILVPYALSVVWTPMLVVRYTIPAAVGFYLLVARGVRRVPRQPHRLLVVGLLVVGLLAPLPAYYGADQKEQWDEAAAFVEANAEGDDLVLVVPGYNWRPFAYYYGGAATIETADGRDDPASLREVVRGYDEVFLVFRLPSQSTAATVRGAVENESYTERPVEREFLGVTVAHYRSTEKAGD